MSLLVSLTGGAGLLASFLMLHAGIASMAWRYPLALLAAYGVFLLLLWLWCAPAPRTGSISPTRAWISPCPAGAPSPPGTPARGETLPGVAPAHPSIRQCRLRR